MQFENSKYFKELDHEKIEFPFGKFYFCDGFLIAEINEGNHFGWNHVKKIIKEIIIFYGQNVSLFFISNRVNSYSSDPQSWKKIEAKYDIIKGSAIVIYNDLMLMNASLERQFTSKAFEKFSNLNEAIEWVKENNKD